MREAVAAAADDRAGAVGVVALLVLLALFFLVFLVLFVLLVAGVFLVVLYVWEWNTNGISVEGGEGGRRGGG